MNETATRQTTTACPATVLLDGGSRLDLTFWLLPDPHRERGVRPLRIHLDGDRRFLPVGRREGGSCLLNRDAVVCVEFDADGPGAETGPLEGTSLDLVTIHLRSGEEVGGILRTAGTEGFDRMSDVLNTLGRFVTLSLGPRSLLVATDRIVRVTF